MQLLRLCQLPLRDPQHAKGLQSHYQAKNDIPKVALNEVEMISYPKIQSI
jgi:hypothetical protein